MKVDYELKHYHKDNIDYFMIKHYFIFDSGKKYCYCTYFLTKSQYEKLGGK